MVQASKNVSNTDSSMTIDDMERLMDAWSSTPEAEAQLLATKESVRRAAERISSDVRVDAELMRRAVTL